MITDQERSIISQCARKYNVRSVLLFGSSAETAGPAKDIDLAVAGIAPRLFFKFYADLVKRLTKPVDLVDLSKKTLFNDLVMETGIKIYG